MRSGSHGRMLVGVRPSSSDVYLREHRGVGKISLVGLFGGVQPWMWALGSLVEGNIGERGSRYTLDVLLSLRYLIFRSRLRYIFT